MKLFSRDEKDIKVARAALAALLASVMLVGTLEVAKAVASPATPEASKPTPPAARASKAPAKAATPKPKAVKSAAKPAPAAAAAPLVTVAASSASAPSSAAPTLDGNRVIERARDWTDAKVPYSQRGYRGGYRRDCSGFVSMAWDLPDNLITWNLPLVTKRIGKDQLRAGDILLNSRGGAGGRHAVIFEKWADAAKTKYVALEQSGGPDRAVRRVVPYPYEFDKSLYKPYRYTGMTAYEKAIPKGERQTVAGWTERKAAERAAAQARAAEAASATVAAATDATAGASPASGRGVVAADAGLLGQVLGWLGLSEG